MAYIGNSPGVASQRVVTTFTATAGQTTFTPSSGYTLGYCDVFYNGVKLVNGDDYTASNGTSVVLASAAAAGDSVEIVAHFPRGLSDGYLKAEADSRYVAKTGLDTNLDLAGNKLRDVSGTGKVYLNLTSLADLYSSGSTAGALVIDTNIPYDASNMCAIKICGYAYPNAQPWEINLSGYFGEGSFYSLKSLSLGHPFGTIRFARKTATNKMSIILGDVGGTYGTSVYVARFLQSYSNVNATYADGWTISRITSTSAYSSLTSLPNHTALIDEGVAGAGNSRAYVPGGLSYGDSARGRYVNGWWQANISSNYTYGHLKTSLWGGGGATGNSMYIMGGFRVTGYIYSTDNIDDLIQFHNWSGSLAGLVVTNKASNVGNTAYVGSDGYVYLRLRSGQYSAYSLDLYEHPIYPTRDVRPVSLTMSNSATI